MPLDAALQKALLDWTTGAAAVTQPAAWFLGYATGSPTSVSDSAGPVFRKTVTFAAAQSPAGSVTLNAAVTCTATAIATVVAWNLYNSTSGGTRLMYGTLSSSIGCASGDAPAFTAANLKITLS